MKSAKVTLQFTHSGEDYEGFEINGRYYELSLIDAKLIRSLVKLILQVLNK